MTEGAEEVNVVSVVVEQRGVADVVAGVVARVGAGEGPQLLLHRPSQPPRHQSLHERYSLRR